LQIIVPEDFHARFEFATFMMSSLVGSRYLYESCRFNVVYQQCIAMYDSGGQICCNWSRLNPCFYCAALTTDKHDTPPSHFKLTLGQPAQF